jgi:hypothetical protein|tara:strand:- start:379 stop:597 length:219 start_codon:yes stop_codon:yes gene_type:complete
MDATLESIVSKLVELDERLTELKEEKKNVDESIKELEEGLILYCQTNEVTVNSVTQGMYNVKPTTGRRLKKK